MPNDDKLRYSGKKYKNHRKFWSKKAKLLNGFNYSQVNVPADQPKEHKELDAYLDKSTSSNILDIVKDNDNGAMVFMLAAVSFLLSKYSGENEIEFDTPLYKANIEGSVCTETVPMALDMNKITTLRDLVKYLKEEAETKYTYQNFPLGLVSSSVDLERRNVCVLYDSLHTNISTQAGYDLVIKIFREEMNFRLRLIHNKHAFEQSFIKNLAKHFNNVSTYFSDLDSKLCEIDILSQDERGKLLSNFQRDLTGATSDKSLLGWFKDRVKKTPGRGAVFYGNDSLSYQELDRLSDNLAFHLSQNFVKEGDVVAMLLQPTEKVVISILSILKAGAAFLPIDPGFPTSRIKSIIESANPKILIIESENMFGLNYYQGPLFAIDIELPILPGPGFPLEHPSPPGQLAYIIFTSGTTGKPKGVEILHGSISNYVSWFIDEILDNQPLSAVLLSSPAFDLGYTAFWGALLGGGGLHIVDESQVKEPSQVLEYIVDRKIDFIKTTPSQFFMITHTLKHYEGSPLPLKLVILGGEPVRPMDVVQYLGKYPNTKFINHYGPTETTIGTIYHEVDSKTINSFKDKPVIGKPIKNNYIKILDHYQKLTPEGVWGEICVGGVGLSRGYRNQPQLTQAKFIPDPWHLGEKLYKTGDIGRWNSEGNIEIAGRNDDQIKIRGYRVELREIEKVIASHPSVAEAYVIAPEREGEIQLHAMIRLSKHENNSVLLNLNKDTSTSLNDQLQYLPNGMAIYHPTKEEALAFYKFAFEKNGYLRNGIVIQKGDVIFDVGANSGMFTLQMGLLYPAVDIYAFEVIPELQDLLEKNIQLYDLEVKNMRYGLDDQVIMKDGVYYPKQSGLSGIAKSKKTAYSIVKNTILNATNAEDLEQNKFFQDEMIASRLDSEERKMNLRRLSDVLKERDISQVDLLKINVEFGEINVLKGIDRPDWNKIKQIVIRVRQDRDKLSEIETLLQQNNFLVVVEEEDDFTYNNVYNVYANRAVNFNSPAIHTLPEFNKGGKWTKFSHLQESILNLCSDKMPGYMIPSSIRTNTHLPLTSNGKIDKKKLAQLFEKKHFPGKSIVPPGSWLEKELCEIWQEVLLKDPIGVTENFFAIGGHSLRAVSVATRIFEKLGFKIELKAIFENPTIRGLAALLGSMQSSDYKHIPNVPVQADYQVSHAQQRLWILQQMNKNNTAYNQPRVFRFKEVLKKKCLEEALRHVIERHESLRTTFRFVDGVVRQVIHKNAAFHLDYFGDGQESLPVNDLLQRENKFVFDLETGPLLRVTVLMEKKGQTVLLLNTHHIICDGLSIEILLKELKYYYDQVQNGSRIKPLPGLKIQYKDFASWQNDELSLAKKSGHETFWLDQMEGEIPILDLPTLKGRPSMKSNRGKNVVLNLERLDLSYIEDFANRNRSSLFMVLMTALNITINKYTNQRDIIIGTPVAGRNHRDLENQVGFYLNMLAIRTKILEKDSFNSLLNRVRDIMLKCFEHEIYPFDKLVSQLALPRDLGRSPLFDVMATMIKDSISINTSQDYGNELEIPNTEQSSKYDLTFNFIQHGDQLAVSVNYDANLFSQAMVLRMTRDFEGILVKALENPGIGLNTLDYLAEAEKLRLLGWGNTLYKHVDTLVPIHELFEKQANETPGKIALNFKNYAFTFGSINSKANRLAHYLKDRFQIGENSVVGLKFDRTENMLVGLFGILKTGAAYLPLDTKFPSDRLNYMMDDCKITAVVSQTAYIPKDKGITWVDIESKEIQVMPSTNLNVPCTGDQLAYVIYTSGSTGKPKGVEIKHQSVVNFLCQVKKSPGISKEDIVLAATTISFDIAIFDLVFSLVNGAAVALVASEERDSPYDLIESIQVHKPTMMHVTPSFWSMLMACDWQGDKGLRAFAGGEPLTKELANKLLQRCNEVWNFYGPTEATIYSSVKQVKPSDLAVTVGAPMDNNYIYILDKNYQLVPTGVTGELHIGGLALAKGYRFKLSLTNTKFVNNPFIPGEKIYKTGDLARWNEDGEIEILGRNDDQVKVRGHRVELGEIESTIKRYGRVKDAVVSKKEIIKGNELLICWYLGSQDIEQFQLRNYLSEYLPAYMIPSHFVWVSEFPKTLNGKIDKKRLPVDNINSTIVGDNPTKSISKTETKLVEIWSGTIGVENIGLDQNFFEVGGHSLSAVHIITKLEHEFGIRLSLGVLFSNPTIKQVAPIIDGLTKREAQQILRVASQPDYEVSFSQKRMWLLNQADHNTSAYHIYGTQEINENLDIKRLEKAFGLLIERHENLRTTFFIKNDQVRQKILTPSELNFGLFVHDLTSNNQKGAEEEIVNSTCLTPFDLENGPLLRCAYIKRSSGYYLMIFAVHHIIGDRSSLQLMFNEITQYCKALEKDPTFKPSPLKIQYKDFAAWHNKRFDDHQNSHLKKYWLNELGGTLPILNLPIAKDKKADHVSKRALKKIFLGKETSGKIKRFSVSNNASSFMTLLTALKILLNRYSGQDDIIIGIPVEGRDHVDLDEQVGCYVNTIVVRTKFSRSDSFAEVFGRIKNSLLRAYEHQAYPFDKLVDDLALPRDTSETPLFNTMATYTENIGDITGVSALPNNTGEQDFAASSTRFDLTFNFIELPQEFGLVLDYDGERFEASKIDRLLYHFEVLLNGIFQYPADKNLQPIGEIELMDSREKKQLLDEFNDTIVDFSSEFTLVDLFEQQVRESPDKTALVYGHNHFTFRQIDVISNQISNYLAENWPVEPDDLVALKLEPSEWIVFVILGIMKSGAAYLPLDPAIPTERQSFISAESGYKHCVTNEDLKILKDNLESYDKGRLDRASNSRNLAYVIYTSGSTGVPKGCMLEHRGVVNRLEWMWKSFDFTPGDTFFQKTNYTFDVSVWEMFTPLCFGSKLVISTSEEARSPSKLAFLIKKDQVSCIHFVPSMLQVFMHGSTKNRTGMDVLNPLRMVVCSGEALSTSIVQEWYKYSGVPIYNFYGPTEASIEVTACDTRSGQRNSIGIPIANTKILILNQDLALQPVGVPGEIYIGGVGLSRGYMNQPGLTSERFIVNPYSQGEMIYKTGDAGKWHENGHIEYLGRLDDQVKIRGYRVELGEIENALEAKEGIHKAVAVVDHSDEIGIMCYFVSRQEETLSTLRKFLGDKLPKYMIPSYFIPVDEIPLTVNGKADKQKLCLNRNYLEEENFEEPAGEVEIKVASLMAELLGREKMGRLADFFEQGGNSIKAFQLVSRIYNILEVQLSIKDVFNAPTAASLTTIVENSYKTAFDTIEMAPKQSYYDVTGSQKRIWLQDQWYDTLTAYNLHHVYRIEGELDIKLLQKSVNELIGRFEILRTNFHFMHGKPVQVIKAAGESQIHIELEKFSDKNRKQKYIKNVSNSEANHYFDLAKDLLLRLRVIDFGSQEFVLFYTVHHIISDDWSQHLFMKELQKNYARLKQGLDNESRLLKIQYKDFSHWINQRIMGQEMIIHKNYWMAMHSKLTPATEFQFDYPRPAKKSYKAWKVSFTLDKRRTGLLHEVSQTNHSTTYASLLALVNLLVYYETGDTDIVIGTPVSGRDHIDLENQLGVFINTLAIRTKIDPSLSYDQFVKQVSGIAINSFEHKVYPFEKLVDDLRVKPRLGRSPLFDVGFTWQNASSALSMNELDENTTGLITTKMNMTNEEVKTDCWIHATENNDEIGFTCSFSSDLFKLETARGIVNDWKKIIGGILASPSTQVADHITSRPKTNEKMSNNMNRQAALNKFFATKKKKLDSNTTELVNEGLLGENCPISVFTASVEGIILSDWVRENKVKIEQLLNEKGAVLFRGFPVGSQEGFKEITSIIGKNPMTYMDQSSPRTELEHKVYTSTDHPADQVILMHSELSYSQDWPMRIFFFCDNPPKTGGQTPICDNRAMLKHLSDDTIAAFESKGIRYTRNLVEGIGLSWQEVYQTSNKKEVEDYCAKNSIDFEWVNDQHLGIQWTRPAIWKHPFTNASTWFNHGFFFNAINLGREVHEVMEGEEGLPFNTSYGDGTPIPTTVLDEIREGYEKVKIGFDWEKNDILVLDNMLMSHGRQSFTGNRKILVAMNDPYSHLVANDVTQ